MTLELTVQLMFDEYPTLFKTRVDVLNHLFCTCGNGYDWYKGELTEPDDEQYYGEDYLKKLESHLVNEKAFQHNKLSLKQEKLNRLEEEKKKPLHRLIKTICEIKGITPGQYFKEQEEAINRLPDDRYYEIEDRKYRWYFFCAGECRSWAPLFNYPKDIKADWLAGIEETKQLLIEDGYDLNNLGSYGEDQERRFKERRNKYKICHEELEKIMYPEGR
jgi:transcriptional regulator with XRE-family HTH domain